ncbi:class I SAM-dependent methyltransferase [Fodinisporobacter ferrooxydans]|uniref:Class I SAM-dependent methyltransferase n=1 Tax=Fodinisporobacter ferrooxydans TaxID=2901836 RepID=A0ABY4CFY5_9BACL|nr:class I SAM-dependent methyltransferase [Alicyclobacillaceae bacterium MYW30-H2]
MIHDSNTRTAVVTTVIKTTPAFISKAQELAEELGAPFVLRKKYSIPVIQERAQVEAVFVCGNRLELYMNGQMFFYHPGMATIRIKRLLRGEEDPLLRISQLQAGDTVLDCTAGFASDAIVFAYAVGREGKVKGIESEPWITYLVKKGLHMGYPEFPELDEAMRRVRICQGSHEEHLASLPDKSYDIVYFDPMFRRTVAQSAGIDLLREIGNDHPLTTDTIRQAMRVARKRVIVKERFFSSEFERLGLTKVEKGAMNIAYGYIDL